MTRLSLKKVLSAKRPKGAGSLQGFAMTDKYYVLIMRPSGLEDNNQVLIIRRDDNKNVTASFGNPVYNMGHGNDATWNRKTDEIIVVDGSRKELARLDANNFKTVAAARHPIPRSEVRNGIISPGFIIVITMHSRNGMSETIRP